MSLSRSKTFLALAFLMVSALIGIGATPVHAAADRQVTIHYYRYAGDYTGWKMWLWPFTGGGAGADFEFSGSDAYGKVGTFTVAKSAGIDVGFIVKKGNWDSKDVSKDRIITDWNADGNAEIWLVQGDANYYTSPPKIGYSIQAAQAQDFRTVQVTLGKAIDIVPGDNGFTFTGTGNVPKVLSVSAASGNATNSSTLTLKLDTDLVIGASYLLNKPDYGKIAVSVNGLMDSKAFNDAYTYAGDDLGNTYTPQSTAFRVWAPTASQVELLTFATASTTDNAGVAKDMEKSVNGTWTTNLTGDQNGTIYAYRVHVGGRVNVAVDPYVRASTANSGRGVVVDLSGTDPANFSSEAKPAFSGKTTDASIYELHVRDLSMDASSGIKNKGQYLAFTETNTTTPDGKTATGVSAIKALGITHVELLPVFDFSSVDEWSPSFNWGYDPENYNVPEGSYSSNPDNPTTRITELKQAIQSMHAQGLRVNMDVVYNHVHNAGSFSEELIVPGYFFRTEADGTLANGTGVGNEVASDRPMVRKFIVDSVSYWAKQYHFDGFRFDLMGIMDVTTMNQIRAELNKIDPTIIMLGEGWNMGDVLPADQKADQLNLGAMPGVAAFNDGIRDGIKGSVFNSSEKGWATGAAGGLGKTVAGIVGNTPYSALINGGWGNTQPTQSVNYVECHDNLTLFDKLTASTSLSAANKVKVFQLASSIPILAQGMPFIQAGQEFLRSKGGNENSYNAGDDVNSLKWDQRAKNLSTVNYFAGLYAIRAAHPAFRMSTTDQLKANLKFTNQNAKVISYVINGSAVGDSAKSVFVVHNASKAAASVKLPSSGSWSILVKGSKASVKPLGKVSGTKVSVEAYSTLVLTK